MTTSDFARVQARIFIIDDEPANLKLLDKMLKKEGYEQRTLIQDPRQVIPHYQEQRPDLILLDINMPHLDGYEVMAQLKALNDPLLPPIVILTAQHSKDYLLRALEAGARDFISKPFDRNELFMRVANLLDAHLAHLLLHDQKNVLEELVNQRTQELRASHLRMVQRLGRAAEYRDEETGGHILRMSHISELLAKAYGMDNYQCELMLHASPMHDVGKIGIPDAILKKPSRFEADEWQIMKEHAQIGAGLLDGDNSELINLAKEIALTHHEKWDGSGYPYGLKGEEIPISGRIAALADVFDALTSPRPYKKAWPVEAAVDLIKENSGQHFDPELVEIFLRELPSILAIRERFSEQNPTD